MCSCTLETQSVYLPAYALLQVTFYDPSRAWSSRSTETRSSSVAGIPLSWLSSQLVLIAQSSAGHFLPVKCRRSRTLFLKGSNSSLIICHQLPIQGLEHNIFCVIVFRDVFMLQFMSGERIFSQLYWIWFPWKQHGGNISTKYCCTWNDVKNET